MRIARRPIAALAAAALVGGAALVWTGSAEADGTGVSVGGFAPEDVVTLSLGAVNSIGFDPAGTAVALPQSVTPGCPGSIGTSPSYLAIAPTGGGLGIVDAGIGVKGNKDGNGSPCGRADGTAQYLTVSAGTSLPSGAKFIRAELDIELKFDAKLDITAKLGPTTQFSTTFAPNSGSDSGPDSGDGDNYRIVVAEGGKLFDSVLLRLNSATPGGAFSLEGGADGTAPGPLGEAVGTNGSVFQVVDGTLNCGGRDTADGISGVGTSSNLFRITTNSDGSACAPVPFRFDITGANQVLFQKDLTGQTGAQFIWTLSWDPEAAAYPMTEETTIDYGAGPTEIPWCDFGTGSYEYTTTKPAGSVAVKVKPALPENFDADPNMTGQQGWCLVEQYTSIATSGLNGADRIQVNEVLYGSGDPKTAR